jgi:hypothetical protein
LQATRFSVEYRLVLAGWLLFAAILASLAGEFLGLSSLPAGLLQWAGAALLLSQVPARVRGQSLFLAAAGILALLAGGVDGSRLLEALGKNQEMIAMLAAVGCLRLIPLSGKAGSLPAGRRAIWQTLFGVHWLGSITNISAIILFGDRMSGISGKLEPRQALVLARGFALAALWSPFFVAMGVALSQAPGARIGPVLLWGLPLSQLLMALMAWSLGRTGSGGQSAFAGYPFTLATLAGPLLLAAAVFTGHLLAPGLSIVSLVTVAAPLYVLVACGRQQPMARLAEYIRRDLPRMGPEVLLFLAAGVLGTGFTAWVQQSGLTLPIASSEPLAASLGLAVIVVLAGVGIHPIVGITAAGAVLGQIGIRPELLALSFLMGWGLGVIISPISGTNLLLAGRYGIPLSRIWRANMPFVLLAFLLCSGCLYLFASLS